MAISNISLPASNPAGPVNGNANAKPDTRITNETPPSTIVTLSAQALKFSQNSRPAEQANSTTSSVPRQTSESSGIQFIEDRGGRISTYA